MAVGWGFLGGVGVGVDLCLKLLGYKRGGVSVCMWVCVKESVCMACFITDLETFIVIFLYEDLHV